MRGILTFSLGALSALGMAPLGWWPLTLGALAVLMGMVAQAPTGKRAFAIGWWFGLGHFVIGLNWIAKSFTYQAAMPAWLGWVAVLLVSASMAFYPAVASWAAWRMGKRNPLALVLGFAGCWTLFEWLRATLFTGFAWNPLSEVALPMGLGPPAAVVGTYGLSALVMLVAGAIWLAFRREWRSVALALLLPALLTGASFASLPRPTLSAGPLVTLVQPNVGQEVKWSGDAVDANFVKLARLTTPINNTPRLILWTESAIPDYLESGYPLDYYRLSPELARQRITALMNPDDAMLLGALKLEFNDSGAVVGGRNSVFAMDAKGTLTGRYDKSHLLPFGEYLPFRSILTPLGISRFAPGEIDFMPGTGPRTVDMGRFGKVGMILCYELIFSGQIVDKANRPDFIFSPSNDAWFGAWGPPQHHAQARLRAIEEGLPVVRVTPTGISAIIDASGHPVGEIATNQAGRLDMRVPPAYPPTLFSRYGNSIPLLLAIFLVGGALVLARRLR